MFWKKKKINNNTGDMQSSIKTFCNISPSCDRSIYRDKPYSAWTDRMRGLDLEGLLDSIELLPTRASTHEQLFRDVWLIIEKYIWPPTALCLLLFNKDDKPILYTDKNNILEYPVTLSDLGLNTDNSLASISLKNNIAIFAFNALSSRGSVKALFKMTGEPVFKDGRFQRYDYFTEEEAKTIDCTLVLRDQELLRDAVLIPLRNGQRTLGLLFVGQTFPIFDGGNAPRTRLDLPWFLKILGEKVRLSLEIIERLEI